MRAKELAHLEALVDSLRVRGRLSQRVGTLEPTYTSSADNFDESGRDDTTFEDSNLAHAVRDMAFDGAVL